MGQNPLRGPYVVPLGAGPLSRLTGPVPRAWTVGRDMGIAAVRALQCPRGTVRGIAELLVVQGVTQVGLVEATSQVRSLREAVVNPHEILEGGMEVWR